MPALSPGQAYLAFRSRSQNRSKIVYANNSFMPTKLELPSITNTPACATLSIHTSWSPLSSVAWASITVCLFALHCTSSTAAGCTYPINLREVVIWQNILRQNFVTDEGIRPVGDIVQQDRGSLRAAVSQSPAWVGPQRPPAHHQDYSLRNTCWQDLQPNKAATCSLQ